MKKASSMPFEAETLLLDEIYEEMDLGFDESDIRVIDSKSVTGSSIFLVEVGNLLPGIFAVVKCEMDEPNSFSCDVLEIANSQRSAINTFRTAR
jgi:hypothetical protein